MRSPAPAIPPKGSFMVGGKNVDFKADHSLQELLRAGVLCNNATYEKMGDRLIITGDSTEVALLVAGAKADMHKVLLEDSLPAAARGAFQRRDPVHADRQSCDGHYVAYAKGGPEVILGRCTSVHPWQTASQSRKCCAPFPRGERSAWPARGMRVLAFSRKRWKARFREHSRISSRG